MYGTVAPQMRVPPRRIRPSQHYRIDGFKGAPKLGLTVFQAGHKIVYTLYI